MITKHDIVILLGGFNGKVEKEAYINDVEHKKKYKVSWLVLEKKNTGNQIDFVLSNRKREGMIQYVCSFSVVNVDTDHILLIVEIKLRTIDKEIIKKTKRIQWKVGELKNEEIRRRY